MYITYLRGGTVLAGVVLALGLALQVYLRVYPYLYTECQWPANADFRILAFGDPQITGNLERQKLRKKVDILGNDRFLKQIAETTRSILQPEYVAVLGDLLSSQWIDTIEFNKRCDRFERIFPSSTVGGGQVLNISGNHDIGYHGEFTDERLSRYQQRFGLLNFQVDRGDYRIVVVSSLSLDGPPYDHWHEETMAFLESLKGYPKSTVLMLHVPLYKPHGICSDGPYFTYYDDGGVRSQNHLSQNVTNILLNSVFDTAKSGIILAGHDHEGCQVSYSQNSKNTDWEPHAGFGSGIPEATVRSIMGEFGGNTGLVSGTKTPAGVHWQFKLCRFHIQHIWWVTQVLTYIGLVAMPAVLMLRLFV